MPRRNSTGAGDVISTVADGYDVRNLQLYARFGSHSGTGVTNEYDGFGRQTATITNMDGTDRRLTSEYDAGSRRTILWDNGVSHAGAYQYDSASRLTGYVEGFSVLGLRFGYDSVGRRQSLGLGAGDIVSTVAYGYDPIGRLSSLVHDLPGTARDQGYGFTYSTASQIVQRTTTNDAFASNSAYAVDRPYAVNRLNQYTAAGPATFLYDANGNLRSDGQTTYVYDAENRLVSASGATNATLSYDPLGRLWQVSGASGATRFLYDGDDLLQEYDGNNVLLRAYVHGPGSDEPLIWYEYTSGFSRRYLHADHQGSIVAATDPAGAAIRVAGYDSWGIPNSGSVGFGPNGVGRFGYTGQAWIPELGMYHYKARVYSPTLGRFLQTDPVGYDDQVNLYAYVGNDPVNWNDPSGMRSEYAQSCNSAGSRLCQFARESERRQEFRRHWTGTFGRYRVRTHVESRVLSGPPSPALIASNPAWNFVEVPTGNGRAYVTSNRFGRWPAGRPDWTPAHEVGHFAFLPDRYNRTTGAPHPGYENSIMGARGQPVTEQTITDLIAANPSPGRTNREPRAERFFEVGGDFVIGTRAAGSRLGCPPTQSTC